MGRRESPALRTQPRVDPAQDVGHDFLLADVIQEIVIVALVQLVEDIWRRHATLPRLPGLPKLKLVPRSSYARAFVERITQPWQR